MTNSLCSWTASFLARKTTPSRSRTDRARRRRGHIEAALTGMVFFFMYVVLYTPHRHLDWWDRPPQEQRFAVHCFF